MTCGICWQCGNCYPRAAECARCGGAIDLDEDACTACGAPIDDAMRAAAREAFKAAQFAEFQTSMPDAGALRSKGPSAPVCPSAPFRLQPIRSSGSTRPLDKAK